METTAIPVCAFTNLADIQLALIIHFLDTHSILRLSRCTHRLLQSRTPFSMKYAAPIRIRHFTPSSLTSPGWWDRVWRWFNRQSSECPVSHLGASTAERYLPLHVEWCSSIHGEHRFSSPTMVESDIEELLTTGYRICSLDASRCSTLPPACWPTILTHPSTQHLKRLTIGAHGLFSPVNGKRHSNLWRWKTYGPPLSMDAMKLLPSLIHLHTLTFSRNVDQYRWSDDVFPDDYFEPLTNIPALTSLECFDNSKPSAQTILEPISRCQYLRRLAISGPRLSSQQFNKWITQPLHDQLECLRMWEWDMAPFILDGTLADYPYECHFERFTRLALVELVSQDGVRGMFINGMISTQLATITPLRQLLIGFLELDLSRRKHLVHLLTHASSDLRLIMIVKSDAVWDHPRVTIRKWCTGWPPEFNEQDDLVNSSKLHVTQPLSNPSVVNVQTDD